ncbi:hypothetical protein EGT41_35270 [Burkholderia cenocepacia]|uniref:Uncharacterized protein n=1 Tax=Burkholderia cenocepacia TaxID=95486 RepID=A0A427NNW7_9BURK|nr:hypothetical protein DK10_016275 [Burkholderia cenocepacia]RSC04487.1 hypothetical protein EGT41_35270 [Burkholderia cenocepacia]
MRKLPESNPASVPTRVALSCRCSTAVRNIPASSHRAVPFHPKPEGSPGMPAFDSQSCIRSEPPH